MICWLEQLAVRELTAPSLAMHRCRVPSTKISFLTLPGLPAKIRVLILGGKSATNLEGAST